MEHLEQYVLRAADELRAADRATNPEAEEAHRLLAVELIYLIRCDGDATAYRLLRNRRNVANGTPGLVSALEVMEHAEDTQPVLFTELATSSKR